MTETALDDAESIPQRKPRLTPKRWVILGVAAVVLIGAGIGSYFLFFQPATTTASTSFSRTVEVTQGDQTETVSLSGTLSPQKQSELDFTVSGTVTKVLVKAGDKVSKGEKLAVIDRTDLNNAVDLASANLSSAQANLTEVIDADSSSAAIRSARAQVTSARASLTSAQQDLKDAVLRSPIKGTVASVDISVGDTVGSSSGSSSGSGSSSSSTTTTTTSTSSIVVIATSKWKVEGTVGAADLSNLKAGQKVSVTTDASTETLSGKVASVGIVASSTSDDGTATFPVVVNLTGTHKDLYSGTTATAVITTGSYSDVLTVPTAAIRTEGENTVVTKVTDGSNETTTVEVGQVFGNATEITSGLSAGDSVLITMTAPSGSSTSTSDSGGFGMGGGMGRGLDGGPPAGGGAPPGQGG